MHAEAGDAFAGGVRRDGANDVIHMRMDRGKIDGKARRLDAEARAVAQRVGAFGGRGQRVQRQAAVLFEALAPHAAFFDEHRPRAENGRRGGGGKTSGAGADHANVRSELVRHQPAELTGLEADFAVTPSWLYCWAWRNVPEVSVLSWIFYTCLCRGK